MKYEIQFILARATQALDWPLEHQDVCFHLSNWELILKSETVPQGQINYIV